MKFTKEIKAGLIAILAIIGFVFLFQFMKGKSLFTTDNVFYAKFDNVEGLAASNPVSINGLKVGQVDKIFPVTEKDGRIHFVVKVIIDDNFEFSKKSTLEIFEPGLMSGKEMRINLKKIAVDKDDNFWISTKGLGIFYWERKKNKFTEISLLSHNNIPIDVKFIKTFLIDRDNRLLIGTDGNGLVIYDKEKNSVVHYFKDKNDQSNMSSNAIYSIFEDSSGIYWFGNYITGISKIVSKKLDFGVNLSLPHSETGLSHSIVTAFCEDKDNKIWIATDGGGLNLFDRKTNLFKHYKHDPNNPSSISTNVTKALFCDNQNNIWC